MLYHCQTTCISQILSPQHDSSQLSQDEKMLALGKLVPFHDELKYYTVGGGTYTRHLGRIRCLPEEFLEFLLTGFQSTARFVVFFRGASWSWSYLNIIKLMRQTYLIAQFCLTQICPSLIWQAITNCFTEWNPKLWSTGPVLTVSIFVWVQIIPGQFLYPILAYKWWFQWLYINLWLY